MNPFPPGLIASLALSFIPAGMAFADDNSTGGVPGYPAEVRDILYPCPADGSEQPALFWAPRLPPGERAPLLVALHTWSGNHRQGGGEIKYAEWCLQNGWVFIHPNFRGPNRTPEAMGSDLMVEDIRAAVVWAKRQAPVDEARIYAIGVSGGGHATALLAGRTPEIWAGVSSWCGISDIAAWHAETNAAGRGNYAAQIERALGGPPDNPERLADARHRSPLNWLSHASGVPLDLNHGINDGRAGSVPFSHSLHAWNAVVPESERLTDTEISDYYETRQPPAGRGGVVGEDALYGNRPPVFRLTHGNTRVTIFEGGHEIVHEAALNWLAAQRKGQPANWNPPKIAGLRATEADKQSGR